MVSLGKIDDALHLAEQHSIALKEEHALKMIPPAADKDPYKAKERKEICMRLAKMVKR